ncbi:MAG TPA: hypothetical protein VH187_05490 [Scandinavium sp.]|jgi:hypothetical protein|uniref:hypothetical protein n=1 Tax=Scandinavium sp. TaxID=2830653 RepID=UPI002E2EDD41|nr:hypothetical protein [Scandinavium sp.]HEX4500614.1 hypothetical protein [Scandinavium sp.]
MTSEEFIRKWGTHSASIVIRHFLNGHYDANEYETLKQTMLEIADDLARLLEANQQR